MEVRPVRQLIPENRKKTGGQRKTGDRTVPQLFGPTWESHGPAGRSLRHFKSCLFPHPSTTKISILVTNNLDREFQTAQALYMREGSPNQFATTDLRSSSQSAANSLFQNILPVSHFGSIFCADSTLSPPRKFLRMRILEKGRKKLWGGGTPSRQVFSKNTTRSTQRFVHLARMSRPTSTGRVLPW